MSEESEAQVHLIKANLPLSSQRMQDVREKTSEDPQLIELTNVIKEGWPATKEQTLGSIQASASTGTIETSSRLKTAFNLQPFRPHEERQSVGPRWKRLLDRFENYLVAYNITTDARKKALPLHLVGEETSNIYRNLAPADGSDTFPQAKERLNTHFEPQYFDTDKDTELYVDAGPTGLGAILTQKEGDGTRSVIAYASRSLSDVETRYRMDYGQEPARKAVHNFCLAFNPDQWPDTMEELLVYGAEYVDFLLDHFQDVLNRTTCDVQRCQDEFRSMKMTVRRTFNREKSYSDLYEALLTKEPHCTDYKNILHLVSIMLVLPISSAQCERGFSAQRRTTDSTRASLAVSRVEDLIRISADGPPLEEYDALPAVRKFLTSGTRARRPDFRRRGASAAAADNCGGILVPRKVDRTGRGGSMRDMGLCILDPGTLRLARFFRNDVLAIQDEEEPGADHKEFRLHV
ncbi:hypothetical protein Bbelb_185790 [Branchiostoma belcheri]|nr:hypothetical protein Bbelb_185790 [Branchiostoma belcheri]